MRIENPTTLSHPNGDGLPISASLNLDPTVPSFGQLEVRSHGSGGAEFNGEAQLQFQANGTVVLRVHLSAANPIHVLILDDTGVILEQ